MVRLVTVGITGLILAAVASAGQIEIGGSSGLTSSVITSPDGFTEANYTNVMFTGLSAAVPFTGYTATGAIASGDTMYDSAGDGGAGVTFAMIAGPASGGASQNFWNGPANDSDEITVPIGIYGVTDVWTMLNLISGATRDANIYFNFSTSGPTGAITTTIELKLVDSLGSSSSAATGQLQDALICVTGTCTGDNGPTLAGPSNPAIATGPSGVNVYTDTLFEGSYGADNSSGNVVLDDQGFFFTGTALSDALSSYLVNIQIMDPQTSSTTIGLSAVTVDAVPEPSTMLLLMAGLGAIGFSRLRRA